MEYKMLEKEPEIGGSIRIIDNLNIDPELMSGNYEAGDILKVSIVYHDGIIASVEARSKHNLGGLIFKEEYEVIGTKTEEEK